MRFEQRDGLTSCERNGTFGPTCFAHICTTRAYLPGAVYIRAVGLIPTHVLPPVVGVGGVQMRMRRPDALGAADTAAGWPRRSATWMTRWGCGCAPGWRWCKSSCLAGRMWLAWMWRRARCAPGRAVLCMAPGLGRVHACRPPQAQAMLAPPHVLPSSRDSLRVSRGPLGSSLQVHDPQVYTLSYKHSVVPNYLSLAHHMGPGRRVDAACAWHPAAWW